MIQNKMPFFLSLNKTLVVPCFCTYEIEAFCIGKPESQLYWCYVPGLGEPECPKDRANALRWGRVKRGRANLIKFYYLIHKKHWENRIVPLVQTGPVTLAPGIQMDHPYNPVLSCKLLK